MDRDEIIRRLEKIAGHAVHTAGEPPLVMSLDDGIALYDAAALLKEQEPKLVKIDRDRGVLCPSCGNELFTYPQQKFCDEWGQAVKWN